jgi:hypothetical protein
VKELVISGFSFGVVLDNIPSATGRTLEGCFIGTDAAGTTPSPNLFTGVFASGTNNVIGGATPAARNLIAGNNGTGVFIGSEAKGTRLEGNLIGTKDGADGNLGNSLSGVLIEGGSGNTIVGNTIAFNGQDGVSVSGIGNRILSNSISLNGALGIDLADDGVTANDEDDPDTGANNLQNFPVLTSATLSGSQVSVTGNLNTNPSAIVKKKKKKGKKKKRKNVFVPQHYTVQFFSSSQADPSGFGEGKTLIGQKVVVTNLAGDAPINLTFTPTQAVGAGERITATATRYATGDTSEFSGAVTAS